MHGFDVTGAQHLASNVQDSHNGTIHSTIKIKS